MLKKVAKIMALRLFIVENRGQIWYNINIKLHI